MITIKMIASRCCVSIATVSKALNYESDISAETARHVRSVAKEMGYLPNAAARALKTRRAHNLAILTHLSNTSGLRHEYISGIISAIQMRAEDVGYDVTFLSRRIRGMAEGYVDHCRYRGFDGVVMVCTDVNDEGVSELIASDVPLVSVDESYAGHGLIATDNIASMSELTSYIIEKGHRNIAWISGEPDRTVTKQRKIGFTEALQRHGVSFRPELLKTSLYHDAANAAQITEELLRLPQPPTCIMFPDDYSAIGAMEQLEERGVKIPRDISIAGFDGILVSRMIRPQLTTLAQDAESIGREAVDMLLDAVNNPRTYTPRTVLLPGKLITGGSVAKV